MSSSRNFEGGMNDYVWFGAYDELMVEKNLQRFLTSPRATSKIILEGFEVIFPSINNFPNMPYIC